MFKIYHGCAMAYRDGIIISITEKCICGTNNPFWKAVEDIFTLFTFNFLSKSFSNSNSISALG